MFYWPTKKLWYGLKNTAFVLTDEWFRKLLLLASRELERQKISFLTFVFVSMVDIWLLSGFRTVERISFSFQSHSQTYEFIDG